LAESLPDALPYPYALHATIQPYEAREGVSRQPDRTNQALRSEQAINHPISPIFPK